MGGVYMLHFTHVEVRGQFGGSFLSLYHAVSRAYTRLTVLHDKLITCSIASPAPHHTPFFS